LDDERLLESGMIDKFQEMLGRGIAADMMYDSRQVAVTVDELIWSKIRTELQKGKCFKLMQMLVTIYLEGKVYRGSFTVLH
jgi:hypothetical protein